MPFSHLGLCRELELSFLSLGYEKPFPVQEAAIPLALEGHDLVVQAQTGTGKTVAFLSPLIHKLSQTKKTTSLKGPRGLVLVPTRELAVQVGDRAIGLVKGLPVMVKIRTVFGGVSINPQMLALRGGTDILVATPGRLLDLIRQNALALDGLEFLVLDEADKMLDQGFQQEMDEIRNLLPSRRQTLLFSATMNTAIQSVVDTFLRNPKSLRVEPREEFPVEIAEKVYILPQEDKGPFLRELLTKEKWSQVLIFVNSGKRAENVIRKLDNNGIRAQALHGEKSQGARTEAMDNFRKGSLRILVATDILARGIDVNGLPCVINYELPRSARDYIHRIGRTGRAGMPGIAISLVSPEEEAHLWLVEKTIKRKLTKTRVTLEK